MSSNLAAAFVMLNLWLSLCDFVGGCFLFCLILIIFDANKNNPLDTTIAIFVSILLREKRICWFFCKKISVNHMSKPFNDQWFLHIGTSQLICRADQLTGFYMRVTLIVKGLKFWKIDEKSRRSSPPYPWLVQKNRFHKQSWKSKTKTFVLKNSFI